MTSFCFFKISGIQIRVHSTFFLLPFFFGAYYTLNFGSEVGLRAVALVLLVFTCVLAHELSHSVVARRFGIRVPWIMLYPIGGVASMERIPRKAGQEFLIAMAGPLFNFAFAAVLYFPIYNLIGKENLFSPSLESWPRTLAHLFWINPVLGIFNLVPAFPMDGGRLLRSFLSDRLGYARATRICACLGRVFAILFALLGLWTRHWTLVLIAVFIYAAATNEEKQLFYEEWPRSNRDPA